jgi:hypothetical protein
VAPEVNVDDAGRRSDEAVRRLREQSRLREEQRRRRQTFASVCALATLAGGISLAALGAHDARVQRAQAAQTEQTEIDARRDEACARRAIMIAEIEKVEKDLLGHGFSAAESALIRDEVAREKAMVDRVAAQAGCASTPPPDSRPAQPRSRKGYRCTLPDPHQR